MAAVVVMLVFVHQRLRLKKYREIREYYEEQMRYVVFHIKEWRLHNQSHVPLQLAKIPFCPTRRCG